MSEINQSLVTNPDIDDSVVSITGYDKTSNATGTGFLIHRDGDKAYFLTCMHVVESASDEQNRVRILGQSARLVGQGLSDGNDLAVLEVKNIPGNLQPLKLGRYPKWASSRFIIIGWGKLGAKQTLKRKLLGEIREETTISSASIGISSDKVSIPKSQPTIDLFKEMAEVWEIAVEKNQDGRVLTEGLSGGPAISSDTKRVIGVVSHKSGDERGIVLKVTNLSSAIWPGMPDGLIEDEPPEPIPPLSPPFIPQPKPSPKVVGKVVGIIGIILVVLIGVSLIGSPRLGNLFSTPTPSTTLTFTPSLTFTIVPSDTPEPTITHTSTITPAPVPSTPPSPTITPSETMIPTRTSTFTRTPRPSPTNKPDQVGQIGLGSVIGYDLAISNDGRSLAIGLSDKSARVINLDGVNLPTEPETNFVSLGESVLSVAFSSDGVYLAAGSLDTKVYIYDVTTEELLCEIRNASGRVNAIEFSPVDNELLAVGTGAGNVQLWRISNCEQPVLSKPLGPLNGRVSSLAFSPDGKYLAAGSLGRIVQVWEVNGKPHKILGSASQGLAEVNGVSFSPNGDYIATATKDGTVWIWRWPTGALIADHTLPRLNTDARSLAFSPDGDTIAVGYADGEIWLWSISKRRLTSSSISAHNGAVNGLVFLPNNDAYLFSTGDDGCVCEWKVK